jgi:hypothetical protein
MYTQKYTQDMSKRILPRRTLLPRARAVRQRPDWACWRPQDVRRRLRGGVLKDRPAATLATERESHRGKDPQTVEREEQEARRSAQRDTFPHVRERLLVEYSGRRRPLKPKTRRDYTRILRTLFPKGRTSLSARSASVM